MEIQNKRFIEKARLRHGEKYDYTLVDYANTYKKVVIKCLIHGEFEQRPQYHLCGHGCPACGRLAASGTNVKYKGVSYSSIVKLHEDVKPKANIGLFRQWLRDGLTIDDAVSRTPSLCNGSGVIYRIKNIGENNENGKSYIGSTLQVLGDRFSQHIMAAKGKGGTRNPMGLQSAIRKYGPSDFKIETLLENSRGYELSELEKMCIEREDTVAPNGYNLLVSGKRTRRRCRPVVIDGVKYPSCVDAARRLSKENGKPYAATRSQIYQGTYGNIKPTLGIEQAEKIRIMYENDNVTQRQIAKTLGLSANIVNSIVNYKTWKPENWLGGKVETGHKIKLNFEIAEEIRDKYREGSVKQNQLAVEYGVTKQTIHLVVKNKAWNNNVY